VGNKLFQLLCPKLQQPDLIVQGLSGIKGRIVQKCFDLLQGEF